jgi:hypothetical protein
MPTLRDDEIQTLPTGVAPQPKLRADADDTDSTDADDTDSTDTDSSDADDTDSSDADADDADTA